VVKNVVARGEIWLVNLDPTVGSEIKKSRPCVVISPPEMHDYLRTVIMALMTTKGFPAPFRIPLTHGGKKGLVLLDQVRAIDKVAARNEARRCIGKNLVRDFSGVTGSFCEVVEQLKLTNVGLGVVTLF
jgi:mRNA interferase MazF